MALRLLGRLLGRLVCCCFLRCSNRLDLFVGAGSRVCWIAHLVMLLAEFAP